MKSFISKIWNKYFGKKEVKCLISGIKSSGKTTILNTLKFEDRVIQYSAFSFKIKTIQHDNITMNIWEVEEGFKIRSLWGPYFYDTDSLIFVVDSNDMSRIEESCAELKRLLYEEELKNAIILVFANKQDLVNSKDLVHIQNCLNLDEIKDRKWKIQGSCATTGEGLYEGFDWIFEQIQQKNFG